MGILSQVAKRIKAYHGSPHDFDKFSTENIGTGEGAQAYGHGLYFAEREGTAKSYKSSTNYADKKRQFQNELPDDAYIEDVVEMKDEGAFSPEMTELISALEDDGFLGFDYPSQAISAAFSKNLRDYDPSDRLEKAVNNGHMYEVNIDASPDELLDYDVDLIDQSQKVKDGILKLGLTDLNGKKYSIQELDDLGHRGQTLYEKISGNAGADVASMRLKDVGIKGIKYADAQTRFSPKGRTNNYVIFDDKTVEIARKYGVSMPVAGAILAGTMTPEDAQAASIPKVTRDLMNKYFTPEAIEYATKQADARKSREAITEIDIDDFLNLAREGYSPQKAEGIASVNQFDDLPFLSIKEEDGIANVIGHEGRHRARRLKEMGESKMPIRVRSDIRWDQQNDPKAFDYLHDYPRILFNEDRTKKTPFPFRQGESNFIPSEFMDIQDISRAKNQRKSAFTSSDDKLLKELGLGSSAALASGNTLASVKPQDGLLKDTGDVLGEIMAGANRGVVDALNFFTVDQINAISQLMGSDKRVPTLYDVPLIEEATSGNFMDKGALRQAVRQGSEFLSPI